MGAFLDALNAHSPAFVWGLNELSGSVVEDRTANDRDGTLTGGTQSQTSPITAEGWTATAFDGVDDQVTRASESALNPAAFTLIAVLKRSGTQIQFDVVAMKPADAGWATGYGMFFNATDIVYGFAGAYNGSPVASSSIPDDTFVMVSFGYEGSTAYMNVDGVDIGTSSPGVVTTSTAGALNVAVSAGGSAMTGTIACVALIPARLTEAQLLTIWGARDDAAGPANDLRRYM